MDFGFHLQHPLFLVCQLAVFGLEMQLTPEPSDCWSPPSEFGFPSLHNHMRQRNLFKCFLKINLNLYLWNIFIKNKSMFVCISSSVAILLVLVLVLEDVVGLYRTSQLQLLWHQWLGHKLGLLPCWMVCLGNKPRSFCCFWGCTQKLHFKLFYRLWGLLHFF